MGESEKERIREIEWVRENERQRACKIERENEWNEWEWKRKWERGSERDRESERVSEWMRESMLEKDWMSEWEWKT